MRKERWRIVERLLDQIEGTTGRLVMAVAPDPLDVVLYETPVLARTQPPQNPLRAFVQEAVSLLGQPTAAEIASLLHLPTGVVELVLGNLQQLGGAANDAAGRWTVPGGAPLFKAVGGDPAIWRRTRRLLCYWPERRVMLPMLPRMRLRDLVELGVHRLQGEVAEWYEQFAAWSSAEGLRRGLPDTVRVLALSDSATPTGVSTQPASPDSPVPFEQILVSRCQMDIIAVTWANFRSGVWELTSRLWSRPTPPESSDGEPFAAGEALVGLSLPEQLLGSEQGLDALGQLFNPKPEMWRGLLEEQEGRFKLQRDLERDSPAILSIEDEDYSERRRWRGVFTHLGREARLICTTHPANSGEGRNG